MLSSLFQCTELRKVFRCLPCLAILHLAYRSRRSAAGLILFSRGVCWLARLPTPTCVLTYYEAGKSVFHLMEICPKTKGNKSNKVTPKKGGFKINRDGFCKSTTDLDRASVRHSLSCPESTSLKSYEYYQQKCKCREMPSRFGLELKFWSIYNKSPELAQYIKAT